MQASGLSLSCLITCQDSCHSSCYIPLACMASEWIHRTFNMDVIVLIRHPAAFVLSLKRLNFRVDFNEFLKQKELMDDYLNKYTNLFKNRVEFSIIEEGAILWNCIYSVLFTWP